MGAVSLLGLRPPSRSSVYAKLPDVVSGDDSTPSAGEGAEDRRKHLEFIQTVVGRMFTASSLAKGWCLTVATAALGFALTKNSRAVALLGFFAIGLFGFLDARYLREERKFRALYEDAREGRADVYEMRTAPYLASSSGRFASNCRWRSVLRSWSLWAFYGPLLLVALAVLTRAWINQ